MVALFDVNGTLTDPAGLGEPWGRPELGLRVLRSAILSSMAATLCGRGDGPFVDHLRDGFVLEVAAAGLDAARIDDGLQRATALDAYPDAGPAVDALRAAGFTVAALTNSGAAGGRATLEAAGLAARFDHVLGVDAVGVFKPHPDAYGHAVSTLEVPAEDIVLVAAHAWDVDGARAASLRTAWVARGEGVLGPARSVPDHQGTDLLDVAGQLVAAYAGP